MGERLYFNNQSRIYHAERNPVLRWYCTLEVTDKLPDTVDPDTVQYLLDATDHDIQKDLQRMYGIRANESRIIVLKAMAGAREQEEARRASLGHANEA